MHHIIPKCLNGTDESSNLTRLTAREHYIAHLLLVKIHEYDTDKNAYFHLLKAFTCMSYLKDPSRYNLGYDRRFKMNSRLFEYIRIKCIEAESYFSKKRFESLTSEEKEKLSQKISKSLKEFFKTHKSKWIGRKHKSESIKKMKEYSATKLIKGIYNPNFNKIWICNDITKECKQWNKDSEIPSGWRKGRIFKSEESYKNLSRNHFAAFQDQPKSRCINYKKPQKTNNKQIREWYEEYVKHGYWGVVEKFKYDKSCPNLVGLFKSHIPEFVPQNGKPRKRKIQNKTAE